jgi:four helix bundle protein
MELVKKIYEVTSGFPGNEIYGLTSQMKRAAVSIPSNIAEGATRKSTKEYIQFLYISAGSSSELETQVDIAKMLGFIKDDQMYTTLIDLIQSTRMMLMKLIQSLKKDDNSQFSGIRDQ